LTHRNRVPTLLLRSALKGKEMMSQAGLSQAEVERYSRQLVLPEVGHEGQLRLKNSSVLVVGAGGLGIPAAVYLAAAGVGRIGVVDHDTVEKSNLHRQTIYTEDDVGRPKAQVSKERLEEVNPHISVTSHELKLDSSNALEVLGGYDVVVDCTDNFPARYLINDACVLLGKPDVYASIFRFDGQASVFDAKKGPCYRCLFPEPPPADSVQDCAVAGVLGVLPGIMGGIQAVQAMNLILGKGESLVGRLMLFNATDMSFNELRIKKNPDCPVCGTHPTVKGLIDYEEFCGTRSLRKVVEEVDPMVLKRSLEAGSKVVLLDVREPYEYEICHLEGSRLIPLSQLEKRLGELNPGDETVVYCHVGARSSRAVALLSSKGFSKARNLRGGIRAWAEDVDPGMAKY
jgi:molybdopterin/thiamine biosynthesis adenylyltransferase/rhodanese-related sulfurtransferase